MLVFLSILILFKSLENFVGLIKQFLFSFLDDIDTFFDNYNMLTLTYASPKYF